MRQKQTWDRNTILELFGWKMSNPQSSTGHRKQVSSGKIQNEKSNQNKLENNGQNNNNNNLNNNLNNNNSLLNSKDIQNFAGKDSKMEILNSSSTNAVGDLIEIKISLLQQQFTLKLSPNSTISELKSKVILLFYFDYSFIMFVMFLCLFFGIFE